MNVESLEYQNNVYSKKAGCLSCLPLYPQDVKTILVELMVSPFMENNR